MGKVPVTSGWRVVRRGAALTLATATTIAAAACGSEPTLVPFYGAPDVDGSSWPHDSGTADAPPLLGDAGLDAADGASSADANATDGSTGDGGDAASDGSADSGGD